jgi:hypothetical protein
LFSYIFCLPDGESCPGVFNGSIVRETLAEVARKGVACNTTFRIILNDGSEIKETIKAKKWKLIMSQVTNLIIAFSTLEDVEMVITEMAKYKVHGNEFHIVSVEDNQLPSRWYGGSKFLECNILIGAYNYLDIEDFLKFLRNDISWDAPDLVQLFVKEHSDFKFRLLEL